jgi:hypothetical protein
MFVHWEWTHTSNQPRNVTPPTTADLGTRGQTVAIDVHTGLNPTRLNIQVHVVTVCGLSVELQGIICVMFQKISGALDNSFVSNEASADWIFETWREPHLIY